MFLNRRDASRLQELKVFLPGLATFFPLQNLQHLSRIIDLISNLSLKEAVLEFKYFSMSLRKQNNVTKTAKSDT